MGKPAPEAPAFSMGSGQTNGNPEEGSPGPLLYAASPPACRHESPGRRNTKDGATPRMAQHQGWGGSPQRQDSATSGLERRNPKNGTSQRQGWSGATQKTKSRDIRAGAAQAKKRSGATSGTKQRNPIDRTAQPSRSSVSFEAGNQRPGRRFGHTHGAICRETAQAARACKGSCGRNLTAH